MRNIPDISITRLPVAQESVQIQGLLIDLRKAVPSEKATTFVNNLNQLITEISVARKLPDRTTTIARRPNKKKGKRE